jgi:hypothetical protein
MSANLQCIHTRKAKHPSKGDYFGDKRDDKEEADLPSEPDANEVD